MSARDWWVRAAAVMGRGMIAGTSAGAVSGFLVATVAARTTGRGPRWPGRRMSSVWGWCEDAGVVLGRGLLAGVLVGGGIGFVVGLRLFSVGGGVFGILVGGVAGLLPALVAAPLLALGHTSITTSSRARAGAALAGVLAMEVWALVLHTELSTAVGWSGVGAAVGLLVGPWVLFGRRCA